MAVNPNAKVGFYTAIGVLSALLVWNFLSTRIPQLSQVG